MIRRVTTEDDLQAMQANVQRGRSSVGVSVGRVQQAGSTARKPESRTSVAGKRGSIPVSSPYKSKLEAAWANHLNNLVRCGEIANWWYEPLNLRLPGKKNFYKPDFLVLAGDGLTFYEIKGRNLSDDRSLVKIKTAKGLTPWADFVLVKRRHGQWEERKIT